MDGQLVQEGWGAAPKQEWLEARSFRGACPLHAEPNKNNQTGSGCDKTNTGMKLLSELSKLAMPYCHQKLGQIEQVWMHFWLILLELVWIISMMAQQSAKPHAPC